MNKISLAAPFFNPQNVCLCTVAVFGIQSAANSAETENWSPSLSTITSDGTNGGSTLEDGDGSSKETTTSSKKRVKPKKKKVS